MRQLSSILGKIVTDVFHIMISIPQRRQTDWMTEYFKQPSTLHFMDFRSFVSGETEH